jgi:hypothetical protein
VDAFVADKPMKSTALFLPTSLAWNCTGFAQSAPQATASPRVWRQSQNNDTARTFTHTQFTLTCKFLSPPHDPVADRPALALDCNPGSGSHSSKRRFHTANLLVGTTLKILYVEPEEIRGTSYFSKLALRYRTHGGKEEQDQWSPGTDKTSVSSPKESVKQLLRAHNVAIMVDDNRRSQVAMQYDLPDPALIEQGCNVDEH